VEFQVEEYARAQSRNLFDSRGAGRGEELIADFEHAYDVGNLLGELHADNKNRIEGDNQAAAWMSVKSQVISDPDSAGVMLLSS